MTEEDAELVRLLRLLAAAKGIGLPLQAARRIIELADDVARLRAELDEQRHGDGCRVCGLPVQQPATGRRRLYCSTACKRRAARRSETGRKAR